MSTQYFTIYTYSISGLVHAHLFEGSEVEADAFALAALKPAQFYDLTEERTVCRVCEYVPCACAQAERSTS